MKASLQIAGLNGDTKLVTNSVTNPLGNQTGTNSTFGSYLEPIPS